MCQVRSSFPRAVDSTPVAPMLSIAAGSRNRLQGSDCRPPGCVSPARSAHHDPARGAASKVLRERVASMGSLNRLSATAAMRKLAAREITAESLLRDCLERVAEREPTVHAGRSSTPTARCACAGPRFAGLGGIAARAADRGQGLVRYLRDADLLRLADLCQPSARSGCCMRCYGARGGRHRRGKTVTTEFATFHPGPTCNPRDPVHTPGGSSSGSAAAVADWMVPLAFGSQTAGSIIRPAAFCGVVGYKPTYGTINRVGAKMISDTLDTIGALARSVPDAALFVAALSDRPELQIELRQPARRAWACARRTNGSCAP